MICQDDGRSEKIETDIWFPLRGQHPDRLPFCVHGRAWASILFFSPRSSGPHYSLAPMEWYPRWCDCYFTYSQRPSPLHHFHDGLRGDKIVFLDLSIHINEGRHRFEIHRIPTSTDVTINGSSFCPAAHTIAAFHFYTSRLARVPLSYSSFLSEVLTIKHPTNVNQCFKKTGYT